MKLGQIQSRIDKAVEFIGSNSATKKNFRRILRFNKTNLRMKLKENTVILCKFTDTHKVLSDVRNKKKVMKH